MAATPAMRRLRHRLLQAVRGFFTDRGFLEVQTPVLAGTVLPEEHITPITAPPYFLQASPEQYMKRLLARGEPKIFQICPAFRAHERGRRHLPEFTIVEWYRTGADYHLLMADCQDLLAAAARALDRPHPLPWQGGALDLTPPWPRLPLAEAFARHAPLSLEEALAADRFEEILTTTVEPALGRDRPLFLLDYPANMASLARRRPDAPSLAERFELYAGGLELANGFTELTDSGEQRQRFVVARQCIRSQGRDPGPMPEAFLADLERLESAAGIALGFDRLLMLLTDTPDIAQVVDFVPGED